MGRGEDAEPTKPSDLSEAERERLKRQYRGVFWDRKTKRWRCQLGYQSKKIFLGYFDDAGEAARAYDQKLVELRGAGARTNFPITEYLDMMPTPSKGRGSGGGGGSRAAAVAAAAANRDADEEDEGEGEEFDQHEPGTAGGYDAKTPSLDPARRSSAAGGRITGLLELQPNSSYAAAGGSESPRHGLANLPAIAPLSTELPGRQAHAALEQQDYDMVGEDELAAAAQLALEIRRSFDGSHLKWHQQHYSGHPSVAHSTGSGGGSAAAAAATGYAGRSSDQDVHGTTPQQQQQSMGTYGNDTAAAAAAGYGGNASLYGSYGHHPHHHAAAAAHHHHQQQHYVQHHSHLRNGSTPGDLYGSNQGWADQAAAAAAGAGYEGHPAYGSSHYPHHHHHHHSHSGAAAHGVQGGFSDSGGGYAGGYGAHHHAHHAHYQQQQHARLQQQLMYQQQQQAAGLYAGKGEDQHMGSAAGHLQHGQQQQQHYHAGHHPHHQQQHGHYPLHHSHSYPGAAGHEAGMEGAAAAGYYGATRTYATHAEAVAAQQARLSHAHSSGHLPAHHAGGLVPAHGLYGSSGDLQQHYSGGLAAAQQQPGQHQQEYDACAAASNPAVAAADYRQRLATYGLHGYASDAGEYGGGGMDAHMQQHYQHAEQQRQQQHMHADLAGGPSAMDASGPEGADDQYHTQHAAAYETEDPWVQPRGVGRGSAAGSEGGGLVDGMAGGEGLAAIKTSRGGGGSGRSSRAANRGAAAAAAVDSDDYDIEDDDDHGSDSDTGRGRGRKSKRGSKASAAAGGHGNGDAVLRTKQRTGDGGEDERGHSYRGVFWDKKSRRWRCQLGHKNKKIFLGYFGVAEDAARAYDQKLVELHGNSAKTNFPIANYLGGGAAGAGAGGRHSAAAAAAESPRAPGAADVPGGRRRSSHAGDASAKASQAQHGSELSWGALGLPRSARMSHDASEGAPRLSWAGADTLSSWDQQDPEALYASKRRRLMEGGGQLPTSPQEFGALTGSGLHGSHQAVGGEDMVSPTAMARQQSGGYRVVETPSVLPAGLTGRHSSSGHGSLPHPGAAAASGFEAAALAAGIVPDEQQQQRASLYAAPAGGRSTLSLSRLASGEVGAVQALSGLCALGSTHADSAQAGLAAAAGSSVPHLSGAAAANAVLAAAGASPGAGFGAAATQQRQSQASRLFDEAVSQYGTRTGAPGLPVSAVPLAVAAVAAGARVSDANTGASSSTATPPSAINAAGQFGGHNNSNTSPLQNAQQAAALSRLNSSEVRAVQALSGIHNDVLPYNSRTGGYSAAGFRQQQQQQAPSPASITETVAQELLCRASRVSAAAASSIAAVAAAAAAANAAKGSSEGAVAAAAAVVARGSADGSFSGLVGDMAASLGDGRLPAEAAAATPEALPAEQRLSTPGLSPLLTSTMLLPPPPPLQLQLEGHQELGGGDSLPGTASAAAAAAAAAAIAAGKAGAGAAEAGAAAAGKALTHLDPGDAFAAEAGWGNSLEDLLMPKKRPSCSGNSGLIGLLGDIGQLKNEADAAAAAVVVPEQQQPQEEEAAAAPAPAEQQAAEAAAQQQQTQPQQQQQAPAAAADTAAKAPAAPAASGTQLVDAATAQPSVPAAARPAAVSAALPDPAPSPSLSSAPVAFITPQAEPMAVQP